MANSYWTPIAQAARTLWAGARLTFRHLRTRKRRANAAGAMQAGFFAGSQGSVTLEYPRQKLPIPDLGRYRLHMETEDCIGCDQCARVCPVDCIDIQKVRAVDDLGTTSDGTKKMFYFPVFDIDMAKCCYCGLCTVVCPTECLTMTKSYDYSETDRNNFIYHFGNLNPDQAREKQAAYEQHQAEKKAAKEAAKKKAAAEKAARQAQDSPTA